MWHYMYEWMLSEVVIVVQLKSIKFIGNLNF